jgi:hypothetical protein
VTVRRTYETSQPWVVYTFGRTHDGWLPPWSSTRVLGRACIVVQCAVCGDRTVLWIKIPRLGPVPDSGNHPARDVYLAAHAHPDRGALMSWALPFLNIEAHQGGVSLDSFAMRLEADLGDQS